MNATEFFASVAAGALIVISGGTYALFLAFARLRASETLMRLAVASYLVLAICTFVLAASLALSPAWYAVIAAMLAGYWIAPRAIWHLTEATHRQESEP